MIAAIYKKCKHTQKVSLELMFILSKWSVDEHILKFRMMYDFFLTAFWIMHIVLERQACSIFRSEGCNTSCQAASHTRSLLGGFLITVYCLCISLKAFCRLHLKFQSYFNVQRYILFLIFCRCRKFKKKNFLRLNFWLKQNVPSSIVCTSLLTLNVTLHFNLTFFVECQLLYILIYTNLMSLESKNYFPYNQLFSAKRDCDNHYKENKKNNFTYYQLFSGKDDSPLSTTRKNKNNCFPYNQ